MRERVCKGANEGRKGEGGVIEVRWDWGYMCLYQRESGKYKEDTVYAKSRISRLISKDYIQPKYKTVQYCTSTVCLIALTSALHSACGSSVLGLLHVANPCLYDRSVRKKEKRST